MIAWFPPAPSVTPRWQTIDAQWFAGISAHPVQQPLSKKEKGRGADTPDQPWISGPSLDTPEN